MSQADQYDHSLISEEETQGAILETESQIHNDLWALGHTPIKLQPLAQYLHNYHNQKDAVYLHDGFSNGFRLQYSGPRVPIFSRNLISAEHYAQELKDKINKEVRLGRICGPFSQNPISNLRINPVGLIPKKTGGLRLISHLSYPPGLSINDFIDPELCSVHYSKFDNAIEMLQNLGNCALMAKKDIKSAFNLCPIYPGDFDLLGIYVDHKYYIQKMLPQGASISCSIFETFSTFIQWAVSEKAKSNNIDHFVDDFILCSINDHKKCQHLMDCFDYVCQDLGVPINDEKTEGPTTKLEYLGLEIDTVDGVIRIPNDKLDKIKQQLISFLKSKKITLKFLQSLVGLLNFLSKAIPSGRAFSCRFYEAMAHAKKPHHFIKKSFGMDQDARIWLLFLENVNGTCVFTQNEWVENEDLELYADASGSRALGCGSYYRGKWVSFKWPDYWSKDVFKDITYLELIPIVLAFYTWANSLAGKKIIIRSDNNALVEIINKKTSKNKRVMSLIRHLILMLLSYNIQIQAKHIPGKINEIADSISRFQWHRLFQILPEQASRTPDAIPDSFLQIFELK